MAVGSGNLTANALPSSNQSPRRRLMVRDGLTFLSLTAFAIVLGGVTTLLFRSFEAHRQALAKLLAEQGRLALQHGRSVEAVSALRTSLSYQQDDRGNQLLLAQALSASGHTTEAENYFLNLWQAQPGDGPINLQLARLERARGEAQDAINYYRAAVFGTWSGDAPARRRDTRLELASYLVERGQAQAARAELLVAAGNNPDPQAQLAIGQALEAAGDAKDAMIAYRNVAAAATGGQTGQAKGGELCYATGDYPCAADMLERALRFEGWQPDQRTRMTQLQRSAERLQELSYAPDMAWPIRTSHLLNDARIAQSRLKACMNERTTGAAPVGATPVSLQQLQADWRGMDTRKNRSSVRRDDELQQRYAVLINKTETTSTQICGPPAGDDALLVYLRAHPLTHLVTQ